MKIGHVLISHQHAEVLRRLVEGESLTDPPLSPNKVSGIAVVAMTTVRRGWTTIDRSADPPVLTITDAGRAILAEVQKRHSAWPEYKRPGHCNDSRRQP